MIRKEALISSFLKVRELETERLREGKKITFNEALNIIMTELLEGQPPTEEQLERAKQIVEAQEKPGEK